MDTILSIDKLIHIYCEVNMELKKAISEWLNDWSECVECNHMCKNELLCSTNEDELICIDCVSDQNAYGQA